MQLSERLSSVASMVTAGNCLADVGTDHGYVPIYLYERNVIPRAIAMDVNKGPLERARLHIAEYGYQEAIETRLSDGLAALKAGEADSVVIAGMGGPLMVKILSAHPEVTASLKELILQPQSEISEMRSWLYEQGYEIVEEHMVYEDGKYYPMFKAVKASAVTKLSDLEYKFGRFEVLQEKDVLKAFLQREIAGKHAILEKLAKEQTEKSLGRMEEIRRLIEEFAKTLLQLS